MTGFKSMWVLDLILTAVIVPTLILKTSFICKNICNSVEGWHNSI